MWAMDDPPFRRFLRLANSLVAGCCALILHLSRVGVLVFAAQAPSPTLYSENPYDRQERHLEYDDHRLDELEKDVSRLTGGAEIAFSGILILNVLGFIHIPRRKPPSEDHV
jgi:hypothetical protein